MFRNSDTEQCLFFAQTATCTFISLILDLKTPLDR